MTDLSLIPQDDLIAELQKRNDVVLIGLIKDKTQEDSHIIVCWHGGRIACIGLAAHIKRRLLKDLDEDEEAEPA